MTQWLTNASPVVSYLIGAIAFMAGSILFLGAFLLKPTRTQRPSVLPSMRAQVETLTSSCILDLIANDNGTTALEYPARLQRMADNVDRLAACDDVELHRQQ